MLGGCSYQEFHQSLGGSPLKPTEPKSVAESYKLPSTAWLSKSCVTQAPVLDYKLACGVVGQREEFEEHNLASEVDDYCLNQSLSILDVPMISYERYRYQPWSSWMQAGRTTFKAPASWPRQPGISSASKLKPSFGCFCRPKKN